METGLRGKAALVTSGGSGIGRALALALAAEGVDIAVASRNPSEKTVAEIEALGVRALRIKADVSHEDQVVRMVGQAVAGLGKLDLYVNNAAWAWHEAATKVTSEAWYNTINTNLSACVWACREVARHMISRKQGSILIIGSTASLSAQPMETSYRVSKTGLIAYMEVLAVELAPHGIRVNMVIPGYYPTRLTGDLPPEYEKRVMQNIPMRRPGDTSDLGGAAVLLLSDKLSSYTTGSYLAVDGGVHLRPLSVLTDEELLQLNAVSGPTENGQEGQ